ncbi:hypothetical protein PCASD_12818 [Puccinia coronata f. sp. avenae]|uniref:Uncharacterized protein n=1 Tax=Puccinia coronata f. sp. avenae TaxID=200324 RepID=A0A2N5UW61_9BASI|nr:hypothetical protein PCASD_12818 [Puccinia coronata f. sp. avenae]
MSSDMGSNNLFNPMSDKLIKPGCPTRDRTQSKTIEPGLFDMALDRIVQSLVGQACPTQHRTIVSDAVLDKPTGWVYFSGAAHAKALFDLIKCSSNTKQLPDKSLTKVPLPWRSPQFTLLAQQLDQIHIHKKKNTKGPKHVHNFSIKAKRVVSTSAHPPPPLHDVPSNLPKNCYATEYINNLSDATKLMLNPQADIDFDSLLQITTPHSEYKLILDSSCQVLFIRS